MSIAGEEGPAWEKLHPSSFLVTSLQSLPQLALSGGSVGFVTRGADYALQLAIAGMAVALILGFLRWSRFRFQVTPTELRIESGLFERRRRVIPLERVQDVDIERGPLHRLLGLAKARVETGGGGRDEGTLDGIRLARAGELREQLRGVRAGPWGAAPLPADKAPLYRLGRGRLLLLGVFNFSLVYIAVLFSALQTVGQAFGLDWDDLAERSRGLREQAEAQASWRAAVIVLALTLLLGVLTGLLRTALRDWNYTLRRRGRALVRRRGLSTVSEVAIALRRIQAAHLSAGPLMRGFGLGRLQFQTLGLGTEGAGGVQDAVPLGDADEIVRVLNQPFAVELPGDDAYARGPGRGVVPRVLTPVLLAGVLAGVLVAFDQARWLPVPLALAAWVLVDGVLGWRAHGWTAARGQLFLRWGWWKRRTLVLPLARLQALQLRDGPLRRGLGLATVHVDSAGASAFGIPTLPALPRAEAEAVAAGLLQKSVPIVSASPEPGAASPATLSL